ncbi:MAG: glycosyltransferase family 4 protein [bacterium]|nr:glycosyltransferase family 4 protein [bacterium]
MKVLSIGTDRKIFQEGSAARKRMIEYGALFEELHIIVFAKKSLGLEPWRIANNVWIYPTNSSSKFLYIRDGVRVAKNIVKLRNFNAQSTVVTAQDPSETGKVGLKMKQLYSFPLQVQVHTDIMSPHFAAQSLLNRLRVSTARTVLGKADEVRVVSKRIERSLIHSMRVPSTKIDILPIYVDPLRFSTPSGVDLHTLYPQFKTIVLMVSRLEPEKNVGGALAIFEDIVKTFPDAGLVIVGSGTEESLLRKKIKNLKLENSVVIEAWQENLSGHYKTADIFLLTSLYEGYGMVLVEAAHHNLAIVTSDVGIVGDILIDGVSAMVNPVNNTKMFVEKITKLIIDPAFRKIIAQGGYDVISKRTMLSNEEYLQQYKALLEKLIPHA